MLTDKESQEIYMTGYREGFEEAIRCFDNFIKWMKERKSGTATITATGNEKYSHWK